MQYISICSDQNWFNCTAFRTIIQSNWVSRVSFHYGDRPLIELNQSNDDSLVIWNTLHKSMNERIVELFERERETTNWGACHQLMAHPSFFSNTFFFFISVWVSSSLVSKRFIFSLHLIGISSCRENHNKDQSKNWPNWIDSLNVFWLVAYSIKLIALSQ